MVKRTRSPSCRAWAGGGPDRVAAVRCGRSLPAAGEVARINSGLLTADADRAGRHFQPRRRTARRVQQLRGFEPAHIGEARLEAEGKKHHVLAAAHDVFARPRARSGRCPDWRPLLQIRARTRRRTAPGFRLHGRVRSTSLAAVRGCLAIGSRALRGRPRADRIRASDCSCPAQYSCTCGQSRAASAAAAHTRRWQSSVAGGGAYCRLARHRRAERFVVWLIA